MKTTGERIAECRKRKGYTQDKLAELLYTKKSTISAYENDKIDIKLSILKDIAKILDTTVVYLAGEESDLYVEEVAELFRKINDNNLKRVALQQIKILFSMVEG